MKREQDKAHTATSTKKNPNHYYGTLNGKQLELKAPTLEELTSLECAVMNSGYEMQRAPKSLLMQILVSLLCVSYGDQESLSFEEVKAMPLRCADEVAQAFNFFRDDFGV